MTAVSDADRAKAAELRPKVRVVVLQALVRHHPDSGALAHVVADEVMPVVAAALAEARASYDRLTADLRALAEELGHDADATEDAVRDRESSQYKADQLGLAIGYRRAVIRLRRALDGAP